MASEIEHDCRDFAVEDFESREWVCIKCGAIVKENPTWAEVLLSHRVGKESAHDHNAGNDLFLSVTPQQDYISKSSPGVAFELNSKAKDASGKRVKKQLQDPYTTGNVCGKGMIVREDPLTGERKLAFSMYEMPILHMVKRRASEEVSRWKLDTIEQTIIASNIKKICGRLIVGPIVEYAWKAAILNSDVLDEKETRELEQELLCSVDEIRKKLITRCDLGAQKELKIREAAISMQSPSQIATPMSAR